MKRLLILTCTFVFISLSAFADWSYGSCRFTGNKPYTNRVMKNGIKVFYNGSLKQVKTSGGVEYWECSGDICVVYPKDYSGPIHVFTSTGGTSQSQKMQ